MKPAKSINNNSNPNDTNHNSQIKAKAIARKIMIVLLILSGLLSIRLGTSVVERMDNFGFAMPKDLSPSKSLPNHNRNHKSMPLSDRETAVPSIQDQDLASDWKLRLVNSANPIPENYPIELTTLKNGEQVDSRIYPDLQAMFDDARAAGLELFVRSGYRTEEQQKQLLTKKVAAYQNEGYSKPKAGQLARKWVATPRTSEHELGLAVDINADTTVCSSDQLYAWLFENSYKYGFIYRYPPDKIHITNINNEPWHFRYVGQKAAKEIHSNGLCLEEYVQQLTTTNR